MRAVKEDSTSLRPEPVPDCDELPTSSESQFSADGPDGADGLGQANPFANVIPLIAPLRPAGVLGTREQIQVELDGIAMAVRAFHLKQPDQVMRECAAYGARLTEMTVLLHRVEDQHRQYTRMRTMQVQRWLDELERQFKIASRLVEVSRQDLSLLGGQP